MPGYLFLLPTGILFAFKKPLLFFSFDTVESVSYTSVLQRTFNLNILARPRNGTEEDNVEFEFSMIDQADFGGIDAYLKRHGLQDSSLAEARRAKVYNVNGAKTEEGMAAATAEATGEDESELQKAQRELEDQEEEDEEDYDPGTDGDSEGSGSSDDDSGDEDEDEDEDAEEDEDEDLVGNEVGHQAEDIPDDD